MALAYREASKDLSKNGKPHISWVVTKVTRVDGQHPSPQSVFEFFSKVDVDPDKLCLGQGARLPAAVAVGPGAPNAEATICSAMGCNASQGGNSFCPGQGGKLSTRTTSG